MALFMPSPSCPALCRYSPFYGHARFAYSSTLCKVCRPSSKLLRHACFLSVTAAGSPAFWSLRSAPALRFASSRCCTPFPASRCNLTLTLHNVELYAKTGPRGHKWGFRSVGLGRKGWAVDRVRLRNYRRCLLTT